MILYHGSNVIVDEPKLIGQRRTFIAYEEGILTKEETIARLKVKKLYNCVLY